MIAGKYTVGRVLAAGGMGVVAEGRHESLDQRVAIKFLLPDVAQHGGEAVQRFLREARSAAKIESDHIVRVFDVGMHGEVPYMVMEYLDGVDVDDLTRSSGALDVAQVIEIGLQALDGLAQAHSLGIVHRDLKPANLFVVDRGRSRRVKILDFGISKLMPDSARVETGLTSTKSLLGSPGYMSPEQVRSTKNVDARTDVWSMGVILYELLTGEPAFQGETLGDVFAKIREEPLPPIREKCPLVPAELDAIIMKCLERDRSKRYANAGELLEALSVLAPGAPSVASTHTSPAPRKHLVEAVTAAAAPTLAAAPDAVDPRPKSNTVAPWSTGSGSKPRARWAVGGLVVAGTAAVVVGAWWLKSSGSGNPSTEPSSAMSARVSSADLPTGAGVEPRPGAPGAGGVHVEAAPLPSASASASPMVSASASSPPKPPPTAGAAVPPPPAPSAIKKKRDDLGI